MKIIMKCKIEKDLTCLKLIYLFIYLSFLLLCDIPLHVYMCVCSSAQACPCELQWSMSGVFLCHCPPYFRDSLSVNLETLTGQLDSLTSDSRACLYGHLYPVPSARVTNTLHRAWVCMWVLELRH